MAHAGRPQWDNRPQAWPMPPAGGYPMHMGYPAGAWQQPQQPQQPMMHGRPAPHAQFQQPPHMPAQPMHHLQQPAQSHLAQPHIPQLPSQTGLLSHVPHAMAAPHLHTQSSLLPAQPALLSTPGSQPAPQPASQPAPQAAAATPASSTATPLPVQQPPVQGDMEQKKKERDKREKDRKEREQRKQRELDQQKKDQVKRHHVSTAPVSTEQKQPNLLKKPTPFICKMQFRNKLPDIPFDPKLLVLPLDPQRYTKCILGSSLENSYKHSLFTEPDLGVPINLIDANLYKIHPGQSKILAPEDQALIDSNVASQPRKGAPVQRIRPEVTWLRKTSYMCNEENLPQFKAKGVEAQPGVYKLQKSQMHREDSSSAQGQFQLIESTFEAAKRKPVHPTHPALQAVDILPVFPDFTLWSNSYTEVVFDADPLHMLPPVRLENMEHDERDYLRNRAIVRGIPRAHQLVAYITPTRKRAREEEDQPEEEYEQIYAFHFDVAKDADLKDNYFFVFTPDAVYYNELGTRVKLRKVQSKEEKEQLLSIPRPDGVTVTREEMSEETQAERAEKLAQMLQPASTEEAADA